jgi:hypothetical protein
MGDRKQTISYNGFPGGLCSVNSGEKALPTQLQRAENVMVIDNGILRKRWPVTQVDSNYYSDFIIDLFNGYVSTKDKKIQVVGTAIHTYTNGGLGQFAYMDRYLHTNGVDPMIQIVGITPTVCLGAPLSRFIFKHNDRCFTAAGSVLYETAVGTYPASAVDNFADGASWTIGDTGQSIIGVGSIGRNLIIFKQKEIYIQYGYTKSERYNMRLTSEYGCLSPDTIKNAVLEGVGPCVIFLSDRGRLCAVTMEGILELGDAVQDILDTIYLGAAVNEKALSPSLHRARAVSHPDGYYILSFATTASDTHNAFNQALCLSTGYPYSSQFGQRWPITLWKATGKTGTSSQTFGAFGFSDVNTVYGYKLHLPTTTPDGYTWSEMSDVRTSPAVLDLPCMDRSKTGVPYVYYWIDILIQTRNEDAGVKRAYKQWTDVLIRVIQEAPATGLAFFPLKLTQEVDYNLTIDSPPTINGENLVGPNKPAKYLIELWNELVSDGIQTNITLESYSTVAEGDIRIHGIDILYMKSCLI